MLLRSERHRPIWLLWISNTESPEKIKRSIGILISFCCRFPIRPQLESQSRIFPIRIGHIDPGKNTERSAKEVSWIVDSKNSNRFRIRPRFGHQPPNLPYSIRPIRLCLKSWTNNWNWVSGCVCVCWITRNSNQMFDSGSVSARNLSLSSLIWRA